MDSDAIVPVFFFLIVVGGPIAAWIVSRVLAHQERIEMIRHGFVPPPDPRMARKAARYGWAPGAMPPPQGQYAYPSYDSNYYAQKQLRKGVQIAFIGFALLIGLSFIGFDNGRMHYGPWLLGGLVPLFVGIAQIVTAVLSGAQFNLPGGSARRSNFGPSGYTTEPPTGSATGATPPPPSSYGAWRPGSTPEIEKPVPPPDRL